MCHRELKTTRISLGLAYENQRCEFQVSGANISSCLTSLNGEGDPRLPRPQGHGGSTPDTAASPVRWSVYLTIPTTPACILPAVPSAPESNPVLEPPVRGTVPSE